MDSFTDKTTQVTTFLKPSQVGATEAGINICGYTIDRNPCRILYVMPDEDLAKDFSVDRLQKALKNTPSVAKKISGADRSKALMVRFTGGFIRLAGANSPAKLASWPIPRVIMDEVDKYPLWTGREANPISLVKERTKNWPWRKILVMSTPTTEYGYVYKAYQESEAHYRFYVPCPECGHFQVFEFKNLKFPNTDDEYRLSHETYYMCEKCKHHIHDRDKIGMLRKGKWIADEKLSFTPKTVGFRLNTLYSPWVQFYECAREFLKSKDDPTQLMNFVNSWLGEPWKSKTAQVKARQVLDKKADVPAGIVPRWAQMLTAGVDCQKGYYYWVIRAWGSGMRSQKIANGDAQTFDDIISIMNTQWPIEGSDKILMVRLCAVDSGFESERIYDLCYENYPLTIPVKGLNHKISKYYQVKQLNPGDHGSRWVQSQLLYEVDTNKYKDLIYYRMNKPVGNAGSWDVDADTDEEYADMITAEQKVLDGNEEVWREISSARPNHYLDCEVYAYVAADVCNVRLLQEQKIEVPQARQESSGGYTYSPFGR